MSKAFVINGVNFSVNKLDTVTLNDPKPCTGISLNHSSYSFTSIGATVTLTATLTPNDTTDDLVWSTSNESVATVSNGVVTAVGLGTATITATCGSQTATCAVTATNVLSFTSQLYEKVTKGTGTRDYAELNPTDGQRYAALFDTLHATDKRVRKASSSTAPATNLYPIILGANASTVTADVPDVIRITVWFTDSRTGAEYSDMSMFAKVISGDASEYDSSVPTGDRVMTVPDGADSAVFTLQKTGTDNVITAEDVAAVTITVS